MQTVTKRDTYNDGVADETDGQTDQNGGTEHVP